MLPQNHYKNFKQHDMKKTAQWLDIGQIKLSLFGYTCWRFQYSPPDDSDDNKDSIFKRFKYSCQLS